jgi:hypothetical protein
MTPLCGVIKQIEEIESADILVGIIMFLVTVHVLYETAATFHSWTYNRTQLVNLVTPLYLGRVASFINRTRKMTSSQAEEVVEEQAQVFEDYKDYLIQVWDEKAKQRH